MAVKLIVCKYKDCINDLSKWGKEELESGAIKVQCPECGALHELYESSNRVLYIKLIKGKVMTNETLNKITRTRSC